MFITVIIVKAKIILIIIGIFVNKVGINLRARGIIKESPN